MEQFEELQGRIEAALEQIRGGVVALEEKHANQPVPTLEELDMAKHAELLADLDDEKMANAQLRERMKLLQARLEEWKAKVTAVDNVDEIMAMQSELDMLRNEASKAVEAEALRLEVTRLKGELEAAHNGAAAAREALEDELTELKAQHEQLQTQASDQSASVEGADTGVLEEELQRLRAENQTLSIAAEQAQSLEYEADGEELIERLTELDGELQNLRASNDQLRSANEALREANAKGLADPTLINSALEAEIEGLRAARATDQAEVNAVLARLEPILSAGAADIEGETI